MSYASSTRDPVETILFRRLSKAFFGRTNLSHW